MLNKLALIGLPMFVLLFAPQVPAQRRLINIEEYLAGISQVEAKPADKPRHVETTEDTLTNGAVTRSISRIYESLPPNRSREYTKTTQGEQTTENEVIKIGYMRYDRLNGGPWSKMDTTNDVYGRGYGSGSGIGTSRICDQFSVETASLDGRAMRLYEWLSVKSFTNELTFRHTREWIGEDGLRYRQEVTTGKLSPREEATRSTTTYGYDANFKIEAPIK